MAAVPLTGQAPGVAATQADQARIARNDLIEKIKEARATLHQTQQRVLQYKSLDEHQFEEIKRNPSYFNDLANPFFDDYSKQLIRMVISGNYQKILSLIFNERFSHDQLSRYFNNLLNYLKSSRGRKEADHPISKQLVISNLACLLETIRVSQNQDPNTFALNLTAFLETYSSCQTEQEIEKEQKAVHGRWGELINMIKEDLERFVQAEELLATSPITGIYDAQGILMIQLTKYQFAATLGQKLGLFALAIPPFFSLAQKIYSRWIRKTPLSVYPLTDYGKEGLKERVSTFVGREEIIERILQVWRQRKHPILVAEPGVGKTSIIMELGRRIARQQVPGFEGKSLFAGSAALLGDANIMGPSTIERITSTLRRYRENVILALDEVHVLAKEPKQLILLRSLTDQSAESLRYCLFATTSEEYAQYIAGDQSLARRLTKIDVNPLGREEMIFLLLEEAKLISPLLVVQKDVIESLYQQAGGKQTETRQFLHKLLMHAEEQNKRIPVLEDYERKKYEIETLKTGLHNPLLTLDEQSAIIQQINTETQRLSILERKYLKRKAVCLEYSEAMNDLFEIQERVFLNAQKVQSVFRQHLRDMFQDNQGAIVPAVQIIPFISNRQAVRKCEYALKDFLFAQFFEIPNKAERIKTIEREHGFVSVIDMNFLNSNRPTLNVVPA